MVVNYYGTREDSNVDNPKFTVIVALIPNSQLL